VVEVVTDNKNRSASSVRSNFARNDGNLGADGAVSWMFHKKGLITVDKGNLDADDFMMQALDCGAEDIKEEEKAKALEDNRVAIVETIIKETKLDVPEVLVHSEAHSMMSRLKRDLEAMNMKFEDYLKMVGKDEKALAEQLHLDAEKRAKMQLIVAEIAKAEKITAPKETVDAEVKKVVDVYKDADQNNARMYIESVLINEEVFKFLEAQK
jgi:transcriptional/translational regulatory protein YebC/TACO1